MAFQGSGRQGYPVTYRSYSLSELVRRAWGPEYSAPDHRIYTFGNGKRAFDSTDMGTTGIYRKS